MDEGDPLTLPSNEQENTFQYFSSLVIGYGGIVAYGKGKEAPQQVQRVEGVHSGHWKQQRPQYKLISWLLQFRETCCIRHWKDTPHKQKSCRFHLPKL